MKIILGAIALVWGSSSPSPAEGLPPGAFGWMGELAGHCWTAAYPDGSATDTQCYSSQYGRYLRGTIEIIRPAGARYRGDSLFAWDPATREITFYYWGSGGNHGMIIGRVEGTDILFPGPRSADPSRPSTRTRWTRIGTDSYRVTVQTEIDGRWQEGMSILYSRVARLH